MEDNKGFLPHPKGFATAAIHTGYDPNQDNSLSVVPPMILSTIFKLPSPGNPKIYKYGRTANPTRAVLEECLAKLEGAKHGLCFGSGTAATTVFLGLLNAGDHVICGDSIYGGTYTFFAKISPTLGIPTSFVDVTDISSIEKAINANTKLIWIETVTNPLLKVADVHAVAQIAKKHKVLLAVDNTFLTPYLHRPLEFGADFVIHSVTKYINGHSDVVMGAVLLNDTEMYTKLRFHQEALGGVPSPFDCSQTYRGLKTLAIRMQEHGNNALAVAKFLESHPKVLKVLHPGLPSHPQHEIFKKQTSGHSGMVSFYIRGNLEDSKKFLNSLKLFTVCHSLGGYDSISGLPCVMTHSHIPQQLKTTLGITDNLIRLSVGLETTEDLVEDLKQGFELI